MQYLRFIKNKFKDQDVYVVGSGPSLLGFNYSKLLGKNVITTNHSYKDVPFSHINSVVDLDFINKEDNRSPYKSTILRYFESETPGIKYEKIPEFSPNPEDGVYIGHRSMYYCAGIAAITMAIHSGAKKIFLYGIDHKSFSPQEMEEVYMENTGQRFYTEKYHTHATDLEHDHRYKFSADDKKFRIKIEAYDQFPTDNIYNMSKWSALTHFKKPI